MKLRTAAMRKEQLDAETAGRDDCYELGKWLHGAGKSKYGGKSSFVELLNTHQEFHKEVGNVAIELLFSILSALRNPDFFAYLTGAAVRETRH